MEIKKNIKPRKDIPIKNSFNIFFEDGIYDLHIVIYYINAHQIEIKIRRIDDENGWNSNFTIKIYELVNGKNNFDNYDIVNVLNSDKNSSVGVINLALISFELFVFLITFLISADLSIDNNVALEQTLLDILLANFSTRNSLFAK